MEIESCEQHVLAELEDSRREVEALKDRCRLLRSECELLGEKLRAAEGRALPEGMILPRDRHGETIDPTGPVYLDGEPMRVVAMSHRGKLCLRPWGSASRKGGRWVPGSKVSARRPSAL